MSKMPKDSLKDKLDGNELDLSLNNLEVVPVKELAAIPRATHLDLSCNLLVTLPENFCTLTHLVKVDLSKNKLTELPGNFGKLENLQHLDLLGNELTTLPESFSLLRKLKWLDLKDNPLEPGLKKNAGDCLDEKQCRACAERILLYMTEYSEEMEKKRQKKLKEQREKEAKKAAQEELEAKKRKEEKKAEKERKKRQAEAKRVQKKKVDHSTDEEFIEGVGLQTEEKKTLRAKKTGQRYCSCFMMLLSIFALLIALVVGVVFHCSVSVKDHYCNSYYKPIQVQVVQIGAKLQKQAGDIYQAIYRALLQLLDMLTAVVEEATSSKDSFEKGEDRTENFQGSEKASKTYR